MAHQELARPFVLGLLRTGPTPASSGDLTIEDCVTLILFFV